MPQNWKTYKLGEIAELSTGFAFKSKEYSNSGDLRVIRGKNVTEGVLRWGEDARFWDHELVQTLEKYRINLGDIVIGMDGSKVGKNRAQVREHDLPAILAQRVARVNSIEGVSDQDFLWQIINGKPFENYVDNIRTGTSIPHISLGQIGDWELTLPPLPEQKAIAGILSALDDKIELNLQMNKTLEEMAMTLYKHWFVDFGPFQNGKFVESELGMIPEGWEVKKMIDLATVTDYVANGSFKSLKENVTTYDEPEYALYIRLVDFNNGFSDLKYVDESSSNFLKKSKINGPEVIISNVGANAGTVFRAPTWLNQPMTLGSNSIMILENDYNEILYQYFLSYYGQDALQNIMTGSAQPKFNKTDFRNLDILLPPTEKAKEINNLFKENQKMIVANNGENHTLTKTRDTLLPKLISGEVRVKQAEQIVKDTL
ncbi:MAG: restriction endonuclease subunit S [Crocinitomicaceae bacterium]|nr:restriction endonuclease subunit S [Crocinitomicaceae bacterium]